MISLLCPQSYVYQGIAAMLKFSSRAEDLFLSIPYPLSKLVYSLVRSVRKDNREPHFAQAMERLVRDGIPGDYLEFGVYRGSSFVTAYKLAQRYGLTQMRFFAFDSFCGLPSGEDYNWAPGMYSCSKPRFLEITRKAGVDLRKVVTVEGFYEESLARHAKDKCNISRAAMIHFDCDLYTSTALALDFVTDLIEQGTILVFDDWACFERSNQKGQRRAFWEWPWHSHFEPLYDAGFSGMAFICTKRLGVARPVREDPLAGRGSGKGDPSGISSGQVPRRCRRPCIPLSGAAAQLSSW